MSRNIQQELDIIIQCLRNIGLPVSIGALESHLGGSTHKKTLQRRLKKLVDSGVVIAKGERKSRTYCLALHNTPHNTLYLVPEKPPENMVSENTDNSYEAHSTTGKTTPNKLTHAIFSELSINSLSYLDTPPYGRTKSSYQMTFIENYIPNKTMYVPQDVRQRLYSVGKRFDKTLAAGTYAKQIGQRLLIDLSYNSSRLEGNTYSKLDTQELIEKGLSASGKVHEETVMIMNHKEAIEFLIENAEQIALNTFTIKNIHYLLSQDLLANPHACGQEREIEVSIGKSTYTPLGNSHQIKQYLMLLLLKAEQINDPFEQSFFLLIHLSYLQAFEDVNKRTARLSCNIPFIKHNLCPLSFVDVPQEDYFKALLYFYETNQILPALELFEWAYTKSCEQYEVVKKSLGNIDVYRIQHRAARKKVMGQVIRNNIKDDQIHDFINQYCENNNIEQPEKFIAMTIADLMQLHEGAIIGLGITESMFKQWKDLYSS